ncbi:hypothetical protein UlMin_014112 [Ulmus minor]
MPQAERVEIVEKKKEFEKKRRRELYAEVKESRNKHRRELCAKKRINKSNKNVNESSRKRNAQNVHVRAQDIITNQAWLNKICMCIYGNQHINYTEDENLIAIFSSFEIEAYVLPLPTICGHCKAKKFTKETNGFCCSDGEIELKLNDVPKELYELFTSTSDESLELKKFIQSYNSNFAFTLFSVKYDKELCKRNKGIYTFRVQGQIYHYINEVLPIDDRPSYLQLYFYDTEHELQNRLKFSDKLVASIMSKIIDILKINPHSIFFRTLSDVSDLENHKIKIRCDSGLDQVVYNTPSSSQVAVIWVNDDPSANFRTRDISVYCHSGETHRVQYYFGCYDPLLYPLLFPHGDSGWHEGIARMNKRMGRQSCSKIENLIDVCRITSAIELMENETTGWKIY